MQLPQKFIERTKIILKDEYSSFEKALEEEPSVSVRVNREKIDISPDLHQVPWCQDGYYLKERANFTFDPLFHSGAYYVQEASSMFLYQVIKQLVDAPVRYLDLCASPGGKTTLAISALPKGSLVVGNEIDKKRANILSENIIKWGSPFSIVTNNKPADFTKFTNYFDVILTDVPCSGEGMFRKDEQAVAEWSEDNVKLCASRQKSIIDDIWNALRPGGILIYSTCTYNLEENEQMIKHIIDNYDAQPIEIKKEKSWQIIDSLNGNDPVNRFMPHITKGEGLFMAAVRKPEEDDFEECSILTPSKKNLKSKKKGSNNDTSIKIPGEVKNWVKNSSDFIFEVVRDKVIAYPKIYADDVKMLEDSLFVLKQPLSVASFKGKDFIPEHDLCMSTQINKECFDSCEVSLTDALKYLRREALILPENISKGFVVITYKGFHLGWVKNIGNRSNNLYPNEWRIRSGFVPENIVTAL